MNQFKALGILLLITGLVISLFMYNPGSLQAGILDLVIDLWLPILCVFGGIGLIIKGFLWKPPVRKRGSRRNRRRSHR